MGPDDETKMLTGCEVIDAKTGESLGWYELGEGEEFDETVTTEPGPAADDKAGTYKFQGWELSNQVEPSTFTTTLIIPKRHRCKTRKRFVKLLMAEGISRNKANWAASRVQSMNQDPMWGAASYQYCYTLSRLFGAFDDLKEDKENA